MDIKYSSEQGFTLMELIIVIALMSIIGLLAFRVMFFNVDSFEMGNERVQEAAELRLLGLQITNEVRNSFKVDITGNVTVPSLSGANRRSIQLSGDEVVLYNHESSTYKVLSKGVVVALNFAIIPYEDKFVVQFQIVGDHDVIESQVLLNNITEAGTGGVGTDVLTSAVSADGSDRRIKLWFSPNVSDRN